MQKIWRQNHFWHIKKSKSKVIQMKKNCKYKNNTQTFWKYKKLNLQKIGHAKIIKVQNCRGRST